MVLSVRTSKICPRLRASGISGDTLILVAHSDASKQALDCDTKGMGMPEADIYVSRCRRFDRTAS